MKLQAQIDALEGVNKQRANLLNQYYHSLGAQQVYQQQEKDHTEKLCLAQSVQSLSTFCMSKSPKDPDSKKVNGDKTKLEAFLLNLYLKLQRNKDHFAQEDNNTKYNMLIYIIACLKGNAFAQIEPFVVKNEITIKDVYHFVEILRFCFNKVDSVGIAKNLNFFLNMILCL